MMPLIVLDLVTHLLVMKVLPIHPNLMQISADITLYLCFMAGLGFFLTPGPKLPKEAYIRGGRRALLWLQLSAVTYLTKVPMIVVGWSVYKWLGY